MQLQTGQPCRGDPGDLVERIVRLGHDLAEAEKPVGVGLDQTDEEVVLDPLGQRADHGAIHPSGVHPVEYPPRVERRVRRWRLAGPGACEVVGAAAPVLGRVIGVDDHERLEDIEVFLHLPVGDVGFVTADFGVFDHRVVFDELGAEGFAQDAPVGQGAERGAEAGGQSRRGGLVGCICGRRWLCGSRDPCETRRKLRGEIQVRVRGGLADPIFDAGGGRARACARL